jgi:hypothetical protein
VPAAESYTAGFAPAWVTAAASLLAAVAVLSTVFPAPRRLVLTLGWTAAVLLVWSAGGVLFDILRIAAVLGIPGLPPVVDWLGFGSRVAAATAAIAVAGTLRAYQSSVPHRRGVAPRPRPWVGYLAAALACPYPLLKLYWAAGGPVASSVVVTPEGFPVGELLAFGAAAVLALALVHRWGRILPRRLLITAGWVAAGSLVSMGVLVVFGSLSQLLGLTDGPARFDGAGWVVALVYGSWLALGLSLAAATRDYQRLTKV